MPIYDDAPETQAPPTQVTQPSQPQEIPQEIPQEHGFLDKLGHAAAMFGNEATMGIVPFIAGLDPDTKTKVLRYLREGEEDLGPGLSAGIKIAGAFATPLPGLGAIKGTTTLGKIAAGAARGGIAGSVSAGLTNLSQQSPGGVDLADAGKAALIGGAGGTVLGGGLSTMATGAGKYLRSRAAQSKFSAGGGTRGTIETLGKFDPMSNVRSRASKAEAVSGTALKEGWIGKFGQTWEDSVRKANDAVEASGKELGAIRAKFDASPLIRLKSDKLVDKLVGDIEDRLATVDKISGQKFLNNADKDALAYLKVELQSILKHDHITQQYGIPVLNAGGIKKVTDKLGEAVYGLSREKTLNASHRAQALALAKSLMSDIEDRVIAQMDPAIAQDFIKAKRLFHHATLWRNMGIAATTGEAGLMEHLMGRGMRSIPDSYVIGQVMRSVGAGPLANPVTAQLAANLIGRGRIPNAMIAAGRLPKKLTNLPVPNAFNPITSQRTASMLGKVIGNR